MKWLPFARARNQDLSPSEYAPCHHPRTLTLGSADVCVLLRPSHWRHIFTSNLYYFSKNNLRFKIRRHCSVGSCIIQRVFSLVVGVGTISTFSSTISILQCQFCNFVIFLLLQLGKETARQSLSMQFKINENPSSNLFFFLLFSARSSSASGFFLLMMSRTELGWAFRKLVPVEWLTDEDEVEECDGWAGVISSLRKSSFVSFDLQILILLINQNLKISNLD